MVLVGILNCYQIKNKSTLRNDDIYKIYTSLNGTWHLNHDKTIESLLKLNSLNHFNELNLYNTVLLNFKSEIPEVIFKFSLDKEKNLQEWELLYSIKKENKFNQIHKKGIISVLQYEKKLNHNEKIFIELIEQNHQNNSPSNKEVISIEFLNSDEIKISLQLQQNEKYFNEIYFKKIN